MTHLTAQASLKHYLKKLKDKWKELPDGLTRQQINAKEQA